MPRRGKGATATSPTGKVEISRSAITTIVHDAVMESYGVVGMVPRTLRGSLARYLGQDDPQRGIEVEVRDERIEITLYVVLEYGTRISEVAQNVMALVKFAVEHALGMDVAAVNVYVQGLHFSDDGSGE